MAVYRVDLRVDDPYPVFDWLAARVPDHLLVRKVATRTPRGWYLKAVFKRQADAEAFHRHWCPEAVDHTVAPWGSSGGTAEQDSPPQVPEAERRVNEM